MKVFFGIVIGFVVLGVAVYFGMSNIRFDVSQEQNAIQSTTTSHNTTTLVLGGITPVNLVWKVTNMRIDDEDLLKFMNNLDNLQSLYAKVIQDNVYNGYKIFYFDYTNVNKFSSVNTNTNVNTTIKGKSIFDIFGGKK